MKEQALSDLLNFAHFVDKNIILNKDGALMMAFEGRGPDLQSAGSEELDALSQIMNRMALLLGDGWMLHVDELRIPSTKYPSLGAFPDSVSALIDDERRVQYEAEGQHFENKLILTFVWKFPQPKFKVLRHWFIKGLDIQDDHKALEDYIFIFKERIARCENLLSLYLHLIPLYEEEFLSYLNTCISGELLPVNLPPEGCDLDLELSRHAVVGGYEPKIGKKHLRVLSLVSYTNEVTYPAMLATLGTYPLIYRWSHRFVFLSEETAAREIKQYRRHWKNKIKGLGGIFQEMVSGKPAKNPDQDAAIMRDQTDEALLLNSGSKTRFGYYTSSLILFHEDAAILKQAYEGLQNSIEHKGFGVVLEDVNVMDAWLGAVPGHGQCNIRRLLLPAAQWAHCLPLHTTWSGPKKSHSASLLGHDSPPVFYAATTGHTPFRFFTDVMDVGHLLLLGLTGMGKSTFVAFLMAQFLRYPKAQIFVFDKDYSHKAFTHALSGHHFDIHPNQKLTFCPLADLSSDTLRLRAGEWVADLGRLQGLEITPAKQKAIDEALARMSESETQHNLTILRNQLQDASLREALHYYTLDGAMPLMDATTDNLPNGHIHTFEMTWLLNQPAKIHVPVISFLINHIDACLDAHKGQAPFLIIFEEAWLMLNNPLLSAKIIDWTKTLRKKNGRILFATQSLTDLYDPEKQSLTKTTAALLDACYTKIYLPNPFMHNESRALYKKIGLSTRECDILSQDATPKQHYYIKTPEGQRLIDLGFSEREVIALCFVGLSLEKGEALIACQKQHGTQWVFHWLNQQGFPEWAHYWQEKYGSKA